ncbi:MAG: ACT domain-containing protein [Candidatus Micrarchaeota archaeon]
MGKPKKTLSDLRSLLAGMEPTHIPGKYYMASLDESQLMALANYLDYVLAIFREAEGLSVVLSEDIKAEVAELCDGELIGPFALITLGVDSDLMAVGFLAKIAAALAAEGISVNAYSAYHHDHILVPYEKKDAAMIALKRLSKSGA